MREVVWVRCPDCEEFVKVPGEDRISTPLFVATCPHCRMDFDWRLSYGKDYLRGLTLHWEEYLAPSEVWDHDHCAMCWQKFMEEELPGMERAGYVTHTLIEEWWICRQCYEDLREEMGWQADPPD